MLRKACRTRAWGSCTNVLVAGSTPCMPATKTKSPALAPRLQVPSALIAPGGLSVFTPFGEGACAKLKLDAMAIAVTQAKASRGNIWLPPVLSDCFARRPSAASARTTDSVSAPIPCASAINDPSFWNGCVGITFRLPVARVAHPQIVADAPAGTHAGQAAPFWVKPFRLALRGRRLAKKDVGRIQDEAQRRDSLGRSFWRAALGRAALGRAGGGGRVGAASRHRRRIDRHAEIGSPSF